MMQPDPYMMQMNPQPQIYDPCYIGQYPGQPAQPAVYDQNMLAYPTQNPNLMYSQPPAVGIEPALPMQMPVAQPQMIAQPADQTQVGQPSNKAT